MILNRNLDITKLQEYDNHYKVVFLDNPKTGLKGFIAIHRKNKNAPSFGATRLWHYENPLDGLRDALRLSRMMSYKAAVAGLPSGGAKGVILAPKRISKVDRKLLLLSYAEEVNTLLGDFITGTDVGLSQDDLALMKNASDFFVGLNGEATKFTALGIYFSIETCLKFLTGKDDMMGKTFAIQGLGKVGETLLALIYPKAAKIYVSDINKSITKKIKEKFPKVVIIESSQIHKQKVDIFSPCALSYSLNQKSIAELKCKIIAGGANNQLENEKIGDSLFALGIIYASDYVINAGGLICVYDEYSHPKKYSHKQVEKKVLGIKNILQKILEKSKLQNISPNRIMNKIAEKRFNNY